MPVSCAADGCANRWFKGCEVRFFRFPDDDDERRRHAWIRGACPRREAKWQPSKHMRVCSAHFVSGNKSDDPMDVDWAPSVIGIRSRGMEVGRMNKERHERAKRRASSPALHAPPSKQPSSNISGCSQLGEPSKVPTQDEREAAPPTIDELQAEIVALRERVAQLEHECEYLRSLEDRLEVLQKEVECLAKSQMRAKMIEGNDRATRFYTGLPTFVVFMALFEYLQGKASRMRLWRGPKAEENRKPDRRGAGGRTGGRRLDLVDEFFMTLIRLRLGLFSEDIAQRFGISVSYFGKIFNTWVVFLSKELSLLFPFPSPEKVKMHTPRQFSDYPNTRIIIDCFELFIERPSL